MVQQTFKCFNLESIQERFWNFIWRIQERTITERSSDHPRRTMKDSGFLTEEFTPRILPRIPSRIIPGILWKLLQEPPASGAISNHHQSWRIVELFKKDSEMRPLKASFRDDCRRAWYEKLPLKDSWKIYHTMILVLHQQDSENIPYGGIPLRIMSTNPSRHFFRNSFMKSCRSHNLLEPFSEEFWNHSRRNQESSLKDYGTIEEWLWHYRRRILE